MVTGYVYTEEIYFELIQFATTIILILAYFISGLKREEFIINLLYCKYK